jgi:type IV pilus assembly protein PilB
MVNISKITKKRLGELLVSEGLITNDQVTEALTEQKKAGSLLGETLIKLGYVTESDIAAAIAAQFGLPYIDTSRYTIEKEIFELVPVEFMKKNELIPLDRIGNIITIAVCGPLSEKVFEELEQLTGCEAYLFVSTSSQVHKIIEDFASGDKKK